MREIQKFLLLALISALLLVVPWSSSTALAGGTTTDQWDVNVSSVLITYSSGILGGDTCGRRMFGDVGMGCFDSSATHFWDDKNRGNVHWIEWTTGTPVTIASFTLVALHDGHYQPSCPDTVSIPQYPLPPPYECNRDANHRGFNHFKLFACTADPCQPGNRVVLYDHPIPLGNDDSEHPREYAKLYDPTGAISAPMQKNLLDMTHNVLNFVETDKWRAEFTQQGLGPCGECGPRVNELDGFTTYLVQLEIGVGGDANVNLCSNGVLPVAIISTDLLDATSINPFSISLSGAGVRATGQPGKYLCNADDVNLDGLDDMICKIELAQLSFPGLGPVEVEFRAETYPPAQSIIGTGVINIIKNCP